MREFRTSGSVGALGGQPPRATRQGDSGKARTFAMPDLSASLCFGDTLDHGIRNCPDKGIRLAFCWHEDVRGRKSRVPR